MKPLFRVAVGAGLLGALLAGGKYACPTWSARVGLNLTEWLNVRRQLEEERRREEILDHQNQQVLHHLAVKFQVVKDLRDHRLTLLEAAARFRALGPGSGNSLEKLRLVDACPTDDERWCRQVISFMRGGIPGEPDLTSRADQVEAELIQHLAQGPLHLPD
jgi:hypothetical protein